VDRPNFGLTLDVGHCIMAGENPAQSAAMVGARGKLFGVQLNDGHSRLAAEDGLMFGSVHRSMALELMLWLRRTRFDGHLYFDTFPRNEDAITEAEYNIRAARALWAKAGRLEAASVQKRVLAPQDAMAALELLDEMERPLREELED
jgi:sugar phosphate isomerase/epimerase